ncbi:hypothetical protein TNCV_4947821 [Trichonephila clavipes]|nr:hypothetical protein TNCV_4947821 [Trichonephila clavipes]
MSAHEAAAWCLSKYKQHADKKLSPFVQSLCLQTPNLRAVTPKCLGGPPDDRDRRNAHPCLRTIGLGTNERGYADVSLQSNATADQTDSTYIGSLNTVGLQQHQARTHDTPATSP